MSKMPVIFIGHGSPMNAIEDNEYTSSWNKIALNIPKPDAILAISAHWYTNGCKIMGDESPIMIYDMYGFPDELYKIQYNTKGSPALARFTKELISRKVETDNTWGYDHGTWSVLCRMYPDAGIPVYQLSVDRTASAEEHFQMGKGLKALREKKVLIFASGNVVHNLSKVNWSMNRGYPWAEEFDGYIKNNILSRDFSKVINFRSAGESSNDAFYTFDHFYPLLYALGASDEEDKIKVYNESCIMGSLSMTSYVFG